MNNADNVAAPLQLLRLARNTTLPTVVHCHLGISRSAAVVAAEICITSLLKGPSYKVQFSCSAFHENMSLLVGIVEKRLGIRLGYGQTKVFIRKYETFGVVDTGRVVIRHINHFLCRYVIRHMSL